jgi:hypothetical protein
MRPKVLPRIPTKQSDKGVPKTKVLFDEMRNQTQVKKG